MEDIQVGTPIFLGHKYKHLSKHVHACAYVLELLKNMVDILSAHHLNIMFIWLNSD